MKLELIATATFGLEAVVKREIQDLGYKILKSSILDSNLMKKSGNII